MLHGFHAAAVACSRVQRNSVPSTHMRCMITANRRARATIAFFIPRRLTICIAQALSQDHRPQHALSCFVEHDPHHLISAAWIELVFVEMAGPETAAAAMSKARAAGARAVVFRGSPFLSSTQRRMIVDSAAEARLPTMYEGREFIEQGGLISYVADDSELYRLAAGYVARILAGDKPGDLPIQQPTKFELIINLKTAKLLGLELPPTLLARADEVFES